MQATLKHTEQSFQFSDSATVFGEIFSKSTSVAYWQRKEHPIIKAYFHAISASLKMGIRRVFDMPSLEAELNTVLPDGLGKEHAIKDIYLLADMLTCLFDCREVGLRLTAINTAMCPRFHVDNIPVRLITTYIGSGTEWLPNENASPSQWNYAANKMTDIELSSHEALGDIEQLNCFDVALLKGSAWDEDHMPAIHRSCALTTDQVRVVLTLDPI
jgi:hypothetical protein